MHTVLDLGEAAIHQKRQIEYKAKINIYVYHILSVVHAMSPIYIASFIQHAVG